MMNNAKKIAYIALNIALVTVATMVIRIPVSSSGYVNVGDSMVFLSAIVFGPLTGLIAGGIGSALSDILGGYAHWALPTLLIKGMEGLVVGLLFNLLKKHSTAKPLLKKVFALVAMICGGTLMVGGYYLGSIALYGDSHTALVAVMPNVVQAGVCVAIAFLVLFVADLVGIVKGDGLDKM